MQSPVLFVMLIWSMGAHGGGATIGGFSTMAACERAVPVAHKFYDGVLATAQIQCVELDNNSYTPQGHSHE